MNFATRHLNCVSSCPLGGRLMDGRSPSVLARGSLCCHCLLVETRDGLALVDTGFGQRDVANPRARLSGFFLALLSPDFRQEMTAAHQIAALGYRPADVRHIVLTHLDFDHAGGLDDFPETTIHLLQRERDEAFRQTTWLDRQRYRPQQWSSHPRWRLHGASGGEAWFGFDQVCTGQGLPAGIALVPLPGHTFGHAGVAVDMGGRWLLQAGDAYFHHREMDAERPWCTPGLRAYQTLMEKSRQTRLANQERLRRFAAGHPEVQVFCSHDPQEFERLSGRPERLPVPPSPR
ncbi:MULTISPECIES: MBL fold metallo-hydrolase [unclassified Roseateles]|uniref:MBL fold metallo-hydrolase n=1 Tax=unclassified Roseateles TaxID=2626991 RepID=UPI0006F212FE|nr:MULTISPECIES: MBL fold metallo-hydrolase [unclassified Roseateles]KQW43648.1 MBL fold metallo-hydrolase [Pelomonas sp. Root405]KRA71386.1 MBL fold metallo-hydrolase [Pelomonas sp. Root662]